MIVGIALLVATTSQPIVLVTDPAALDAVRVDLGALAFDSSGSDAAALAASRRYRDVVDTLRADLREMYTGDPRWGVGMKYTHRGFDPAWLAMPNARWQLAAVVNRLDRKVFHGAAPSCGELRLIFRLAYDTKELSSRLPATMNVVFLVPDDGEGCRLHAAALHMRVGTKGKELATLLEQSVLSRLKPERLKSVEINVQTARWPSTIRPDLGGHADYVLRVFHPKGARLVAAALENTPDVDRLKKDTALRGELVRWLKDAKTIAAVDAGTVVMPERFAATRAVSVTPRGLSRPQNRPWTRLIKPSDLADLDLAATQTTRSPAALLRRLDGLTCMGCHQSRSLAGFHVVGEERDASRTVDALAVGVSPHVEEDLPRRVAYLARLASGQPVDERRRPPEHQIARGAFGDSCGQGDPGFAHMTCAAGLSCIAVDDTEVGACMPTAPVVGGACMPGKVDFAKDTIRNPTHLACAADAVCEDVSVGFPGGMCAANCGTTDPGATCGAIALLTPFNTCLARGGLFSTCAQHARPAALRACGAGNPCRADYLCAKTPTGAGACLPPYFVLQMRVDGHPLPSTKRTAIGADTIVDKILK